MNFVTIMDPLLKPSPFDFPDFLVGLHRLPFQIPFVRPWNHFAISISRRLDISLWHFGSTFQAFFDPRSQIGGFVAQATNCFNFQATSVELGTLASFDQNS
jgi:hypothetical protein